MTALAITPLERETHAALPTNEPTFNKKHAEDILNPCGLGDYITIDEHGVWPKIERDSFIPEETELMRWRPARVFRNDPGAPEVADTPMLPSLFTARHLAAFMVNGVGLLVAERYGDLGDAEPDPDSLNAIDPDSKARTAVIQAFAAYHEAKKIVPNAPDGASDIDALVRYLLAEPNAAPAQNAAPTPDAVETVNAGPVDRGWVMKKAALIKKHGHQWATIDRDFKDASENLLSRMAKATGHGEWFEGDALKWAEQRGKLTSVTDRTAPVPATLFTGLTHKIKG